MLIHKIIRMTYLSAFSHPDDLWALQDVIRMTYDIVLCHPDNIIWTVSHPDELALGCISSGRLKDTAVCHPGDLRYFSLSALFKWTPSEHLLVDTLKIITQYIYQRIINKSFADKISTHRGRVTHICVGKLSIIASDNGVSPGRHQAIIWTNTRTLLNGALGTNYRENSIAILTFSFTKMRLKLSSGKWRPSCFARPQCVKSWYSVASMVLIKAPHLERTLDVTIQLKDEKSSTNMKSVCHKQGPIHDDVIKWKILPRYWPFVRGIHRSPVESPHKVQWRGALIFSLIRT